ncbi:hypothetical protein HK099_000211 [Clydaea vesicula]|uniref:Uncharacterized protein n=1 Tax=Clydaea vesicula TaxID=447962 RepID=A0AAD5TXJ1_9FUNG|nr:hypothetical protein HK099_000211 [Clydaea vesicula]
MITLTNKTTHSKFNTKNSQVRHLLHQHSKEQKELFCKAAYHFIRGLWLGVRELETLSDIEEDEAKERDFKPFEGKKLNSLLIDMLNQGSFYLFADG